eukprot:478682_1
MKLNQNVHIIDFSLNIHFQANLFDLIPYDIIVSHRKRYKVTTNSETCNHCIVNAELMDVGYKCINPVLETYCTTLAQFKTTATTKKLPHETLMVIKCIKESQEDNNSTYLDHIYNSELIDIMIELLRINNEELLLLTIPILDRYIHMDQKIANKIIRKYYVKLVMPYLECNNINVRAQVCNSLSNIVSNKHLAGIMQIIEFEDGKLFKLIFKEQIREYQLDITKLVQCQNRLLTNLIQTVPNHIIVTHLTNTFVTGSLKRMIRLVSAGNQTKITKCLEYLYKIVGKIKSADVDEYREMSDYCLCYLDENAKVSLFQKYFFHKSKIVVRGTEIFNERNKSKKCLHYTYGSIENYFHFLSSKKLKTKTKQIKRSITLCENGCCKQCSFDILNLINKLGILNQHNRYQLCAFMGYKSNKKWSKAVSMFNFLYPSEHCDVFIAYFTVCLQHSHVANYIFNQSNLWLVLLHLIATKLIGLTKELDVLLNRMRYDTICYLSKDQKRSLHIVSSILVQIVHNIKLLKSKHFEIIALNKRCLGTFLSFVEIQSKIGMVIDNYAVRKCVSAILIFSCFTLYSVTDKTFKSALQVNGIFDKFKENNTILHQAHNINPFLSLKDKDWLQNVFNYFNGSAYDLFKFRWNNMECQNVYCRNKRLNTVNFKKCKSCRVVRYCSRKCQKIDWSRNKHKEICMKIEKLKQIFI